MNTTNTMRVPSNRDNYRKLENIQYAINRLQRRIDDAAREIEENDKKDVWFSHSKRFAAVKRALLDFKLDCKL